MNVWFSLRFPGSARYWELRYRLGGTSGAGSYGADRAHKSAVINAVVDDHAVQSLIDFGCGDGSQLQDLRITRYLGFDVSLAALSICRQRYAERHNFSFREAGSYAGEQAELALSLDVLYHLVEDTVYLAYLDRLFGAAERLVLIYSSNASPDLAHQARHVRHRSFTADVSARYPQFSLLQHIARPSSLGGPGPGRAEFFLFQRQV
jgi:SAM-dependent methyltransferase